MIRLPGIAVAAGLLLAAPAHAGPEPVAQRLDADTLLIPGGFEPGRQPDGNSVILEGPEGLIVFDTGRHKAQVKAILEAAAGRPVVAVLNSHWHLDHSSGNLPLREAFPKMRVYGSNAVEGALEGFLKKSAEAGQAALDANQLPPAMAEDVRGDIATVRRGDALKPDVVVAENSEVKIAGRKLSLRLARWAATQGDLWIYDRAAKRVIAGDLVTLPAPFLDTACPEGWDEALDTIAATDFETLVPGHGPVMTRADFLDWKLAFEGFLDCSGSERPVVTCAGGWSQSVARFLTDQRARDQAMGLATYYVELLRKGSLAANCRG